MAKISLGTHFSDGLRTGPIYTAQLSAAGANGVTPVNGIITSNNYSAYGPGVLHSVQNSYNIKATPASTIGGFTGLNNIVAAIGNIGAGNLTLRGDNVATFLNRDKTGAGIVQLDWPKVPSVTVTGGALAQATSITIFGYDYYGFPLQHTYIVQAAGTYPSINAGADGTNDNMITNAAGTVLLPAKAFYQITRVHTAQAIAAGRTISIGASVQSINGNADNYTGNPIIDVFGLPYVVKGDVAVLGSPNGAYSGVVTSVQWGRQTGGIANPIIPFDERCVRNYGLPLSFLGAFVAADLTNPSTAATGDVRGLYAPSRATKTQVVGGKVVDATNLIFTTFVRGFDNFINQTAAKQQEYMQSTGSLTPQGVPVTPLVPADAYGVPQFYTGNPS